VEGDRYAVVAVRESVEELLRLERHPLAWRNA
jgi:hypothetical protein